MNNGDLVSECKAVVHVPHPVCMDVTFKTRQRENYSAWKTLMLDCLEVNHVRVISLQ